MTHVFEPTGAAPERSSRSDAADSATPLTRRQLRELRAREALQGAPEAPSLFEEPDAAAATAEPERTPSVGGTAAVVPSEATPVAQSEELGAADNAGARTAPRSFASLSSLFAPTADAEEVTPAAEQADLAPIPQLFATTAPTPVTQKPAAPKPSRVKQLFAASFSATVIGIVGLTTVGMTIPVSTANAYAASVGVAAEPGSRTADIVAATSEAPEEEVELQTFVTSAEGGPEDASRSMAYSTFSAADVAAEAAVSNVSDFYVNNPNAAIQWPFPVGVSITWGYQWRDGRMHNGADFTPGEGAHIQAIAEGTVRVAQEDGGSYGVQVIIDHVIDGQLISTRYAHMQYGSLQVQTGDVVEAGQMLGLVGNTGYSFGAHLHFEVLSGGTTPIDPIAWLRENAGRDSLG